MTKTVVFGLDGACWDLLQPWLDEGRLPTLAGLIEEGGRAPLESCVPATTPPAWTTLTTGVEPGKHGVFAFYERHRGTYDTTPVSDRTVHARRLWEYLSEAGERSIVLNVPVTHPPRDVDGVVVPGYLAPDPPETHPPDVLDTVGFEDYRVYAPSEAEDVSDERRLDEWLALSRDRAELAMALMDAHEWDHLFVEFQKTDGAVHAFNDDRRVREIYECVDDCMADILGAINEPVNVFVVSDHGIGQEKSHAVALNTWLQSEGYLQTSAGGGTDGESWKAAAVEDGPNGGDDDGASVMGALAGVGLTRQRIERSLSAVGLYDIVRRLAPDRLKDAVEQEEVDRATSDAFYEGFGFSGVDTGVVINDVSFYDEGTVTAERYEELRNELIRRLRSLEGPVGRPFEAVRRRETVYSGPRTEFAPDIILEQAPVYVIGSSQPRGKVFIETEPGRIDHRRTGLLVAAGPSIESGWDLTERPTIADVTPTLLHLHGCPVDENFDGAALTGLFVDDSPVESREYEPYDPGSAHQLSGDEETAYEQRLKRLGYLD